YLVFRVLSLIAPKTPPTVAYRILGWVGDLAYRLLSRQRSNVQRNLSVVLNSDTEGADILAREVFREGARYYYDNFRIPSLSDEELEEAIHLEGWENLEGGLAKGKGVVLVSAHLGSPVLVAQILAARKLKVVSVVEAISPPQLLDLMVRIRGSRGIRLVPFHSNIVRELTESLERNEIVGLVADRDIQKNGVPVLFFGRETTIPIGPIMLAIRTGATVIPAFTYRNGDNRFLAHIGSPLELERTGKLKDDIRINTQRLAGIMEKAISAKPEQWIVFEPVWS
ncbi:MAG: lysophospholipid acyltransferase family protein, partial [Chloroflexota bacterium]